MCAYKSKPDNMEGLSSLIQQRFTLFLISLHLYIVLHNRVVWLLCKIILHCGSTRKQIKSFIHINNQSKETTLNSSVSALPYSDS